MISRPWYISASAVRDYLAIKGLAAASPDGPEFERAEAELLAMAADCVQAERRKLEPRKPKLLDSGAYRYRGPAPRRLMLIVSYDKRREGHLPQLIRVLPESERRR